jgi:hypothetical protein
MGFAPSRPHAAQDRIPMEAERLNTLASLITDLRHRVLELRGYL